MLKRRPYKLLNADEKFGTRWETTQLQDPYLYRFIYSFIYIKSTKVNWTEMFKPNAFVKHKPGIQVCFFRLIQLQGQMTGLTL